MFAFYTKSGISPDTIGDEIMRWKGREQSDNVEDRRGKGGGRAVAGGGIGILIVAVIIMVMGGDPSQLLGQLQSAPAQSSNFDPNDPKAKEDEEFVRVVLNDTEDVWSDQFQRMGMTYKEPILVMFSGQVDSACGLASSAVGPFYCPPDQQVYIDTTFFDEMETRFKAKGDFAQAYVIAHEVGHHVQNLLGVAAEVDKARQRLSKEEFNQLSVRMELQADFYAGVWAHHAQRTKDILNEQDIKDALRAANAIGDDKIQMESQGYVVPDAFTHGTSEQRMRWFMKGWQTGDMRQGDTFRARQL